LLEVVQVLITNYVENAGQTTWPGMASA